VKKINWEKVKEVIESQLGENSFRKIEGKGVALIFHEKYQLAILKDSNEESDSNNLHFRLSAPPGIAAWVACLLRSCCSFTIMSHYEITEDGEFINESEMFEDEDESEDEGDVNFKINSLPDSDDDEDEKEAPPKIDRSQMH
jgi:hypothetical protein